MRLASSATLIFDLTHKTFISSDMVITAPHNELYIYYKLFCLACQYILLAYIKNFVDLR